MRNLQYFINKFLTILCVIYAFISSISINKKVNYSYWRFFARSYTSLHYVLYFLKMKCNSECFFWNRNDNIQDQSFYIEFYIMIFNYMLSLIIIINLKKPRKIYTLSIWHGFQSNKMFISFKCNHIKLNLN